MNEYLNSIYYTEENPASYGSVEKLYKQSKKDGKKVNRRVIKRWLAEQETYTRHRNARRRYRRSRVITYAPFYLWQADLVDMQSLARYNDGNRYILTVIDTFTKKLWAIPVKKKSATHVEEAFTQLFQEAEEPPKYMHFDKGTEFLNKKVEALLTSKGIHYFSTYSELKANIVERVNRTLKSCMYKHFTAKMG